MSYLTPNDDWRCPYCGYAGSMIVASGPRWWMRCHRCDRDYLPGTLPERGYWLTVVPWKPGA